MFAVPSLTLHRSCLQNSLPSKGLTLCDPQLPAAGPCGDTSLARGAPLQPKPHHGASQPASFRCEFLLQTRGRDFVRIVQEARCHPLCSWVSPASPWDLGEGSLAPPPSSSVDSRHRCSLSPFRTNQKSQKTGPLPSPQVSRGACPRLCSPGAFGPPRGGGDQCRESEAPRPAVTLRAQGAACGGTVPGAAGERKQPLLPLSNPPWASPTPGWHWERGEEMQVYQVPPVPRGGCSREPTRGSGCCLH